jgi:ubiquinone/menaquinone biosynthesis C-methylase UbiE
MQSDQLKEDSEGLIERAEILKRCKVENKTVLDIGAGPLAVIAARDFHCTVTNIDISEDALRDAKRDAEEAAKRITFEIICDATSLSYPNRSFDVVISYAVLHHIELDERRKFIQEAYRVAKEKVIVAEFTSEGFDKIHAVSDFKAVDLEWLERELNSLGEVDKYTGMIMNVYVLFIRN